MNQTDEPIQITLPEPLVFYLVRNQEGKFFHAKGFSGYGDTWVTDVKKAKVYQKLGQARSRVTFFAKNYPDYGVPEILEVTSTQAVVHQEAKRVAKAIQKEKEARIVRERRQIESTRRSLEDQRKRLDIQLQQLKGNR